MTTLQMPQLGVRVEIRKTAQDTAGELFEFDVVGRARVIAGNRETLTATCRKLGYELPDSQANFLWITLPGVDGAELAARIERAQVIVAAGGPLGEPGHVRVTVPAREEHMTRLIRALELAASGA